MFLKSRFFILCTLLALLVVAFTVAASPSAQSADPIPTSTNQVFRFADGSSVEHSWSTLNRYDDGLAMTLHTDDLTPGDTYTIWWVVFNQPQNCSDGVCNDNDIFQFDDAGNMVTDDAGESLLNMDAIEAAQISVQYATGSYVDDSIGHFAAAVGLGQVPGIVFGPGVVEPTSAEVHLVVRTHGEMIDTLFDEQILTFAGACDINVCIDEQFSVHQPA